MKFLKTAIILLLSLTGVYNLINYNDGLKIHCFIHECNFDLNNATEFEYRKNVYRSNLDFINEHNSNHNNTFKLGLNKYSTLTNEEYKNLLGFSQITLSDFTCDDMTSYLPNSHDDVNFDWVSSGNVTSVKNQGQCGSCWAFSATGAYETWYSIHNNALYDFSEQELVDCDTEDNGCNGGLMTSAFKYIANNGLCLLSEYKYDALQNKCLSETCKHLTNNLPTGCYNVPSGNNLLLKNAAQQTAVSIAIEADSQYFQLYRSGILNNDVKCGTNLDHGVLLVGYGHDEKLGLDYWLVKNSWGSSWGENGYVRLLRSSSEHDDGLCGIAMSASFLH